jgi:dipeptidyl-peptidase-3
MTIRQIITLSGIALAVGCASAPEKGETATTATEATGGGGPIVETVGDVAIVPMETYDFNKLDKGEKLVAWHLTQAAIASHPLVYLQNYRHDLAIWQLVDTLAAKASALDPEFAEKLREYRRKIFIHHGVHDHWTDEKFLPTFDHGDLLAQIAKAGLGPTLEPKARELKAAMFDPNVDRIRTNKTPGAGIDPISASAVNHYGPGVTMGDLAKFQDRYPLNSRIVKKDGRLIEEPYRAGGGGAPAGLGAEYLAATIGHLRTAMPHVPGSQKLALETLTDYFKTGDNASFDAHDVLWLKRSWPVDYILGFVEVYSDPRQVKGLWEGIVAIKDPKRDPPIQRLSKLATYFEAKMPWKPAYKRPPSTIEEPTGAAVNVVGAGGDGLAFTFAGVNLPNKETIKEKHGSKNWIAVSVMDAQRKVNGDKLAREFVWPEMAADAARCSDAVRVAEVAFHELMGHASGKQDSAVTDPRRALAPHFSALEESRADLVAYHHSQDPKTLEIGLLPDPGCQKVAPWLVASSFLTYLRVVPHGDLAEEDHLRGRLLLQGWQTERGAVKIVQRDGKRYAQITDGVKWREGVASLLAELQRIKSTGDKKAIEALIQKHATRIDASLRDEVVRRIKGLGLPARLAYLPPVLEASRDKGGRITDVTARPARNVDDMIETFHQTAGTPAGKTTASTPIPAGLAPRAALK